MDSVLNEDIIVPIALFAMVVLLVWIGHKVKSTRIQEQGELRKRLLDKFSSGHELTEFLATPQGQTFLKDQEVGGAQRSPRGRIISSVGVGVVLLMLGSACFGLMFLKRAFVYPGTILAALGLGMLIAAAISYRLYKQWNMLQ
jgi:hypothetical protein